MVQIKAASRRRLVGRAAVDSATTTLRRRCWRRTSGATGWSIKPAMLAQAVCKLEGFTYAPSDTVYWQQGHSTERDFIYVTTQNLSHDQLQALSDEVGEERSLLVMCSAFRGKADKSPNLTIKKIPKTVLSRCEWGHDDYSLKIENLPTAPLPPGQQEFDL
jgi:adenine-specific DNA-methyltransferase